MRLYNLTDDPGETTNLHARHQIRADQLNRKIEQFLRDAGAVRPRPNPNFKPEAFQPGLIGVSARKP